MPNIVIEIRMPDFIKAAEILAAAMGVLKARIEDKQPLPSEKPQVTPAAPKTPEPEQTATPAPTQVQTPSSSPVSPSNPEIPVTPVIPTAPPTTFSIEAIQAAIAPLMPAKQKELKGLLEKFNVQGLTQLTAEQRGLFAQEIRAMGAKI